MGVTLYTGLQVLDYRQTRLDIRTIGQQFFMGNLRPLLSSLSPLGSTVRNVAVMVGTPPECGRGKRGSENQELYTAALY